MGDAPCDVRPRNSGTAVGGQGMEVAARHSHFFSLEKNSRGGPRARTEVRQGFGPEGRGQDVKICAIKKDTHPVAGTGTRVYARCESRAPP